MPLKQINQPEGCALEHLQLSTEDTNNFWSISKPFTIFSDNYIFTKFTFIKCINGEAYFISS